MDQLPRLGKRELICLLSFTCNYVVSVWRGFLFLWVLGMGYVILLWHFLSLPYNYFKGPQFDPRPGPKVIIIFLLLHLAPNVNNSYNVSNIDSWNVELRFNVGGICSSVRYNTHLYCLAIQAGFYSGVVEINSFL